jgi:hypothetical protein
MGKMRNASIGNLKGDLEDQVVDGSIILKWTLKKES